jgi:REP-associated tyrosine transposase
MARRRRIAPGGVVYHVFNRGSRKGPLFRSSEDYDAFIRLVEETRAIRPMRIIAYCLMPNHWHFLLWPEEDGHLSRFMHWLTTTHAGRWRRDSVTKGEGAVYQSRFSAVVVGDLHHLFKAWCYVERNPVEAGLVVQAQDWPWSSATESSNTSERLSLDVAPIPRPPLSFVNAAEAPISEDVTFAH